MSEEINPPLDLDKIPLSETVSLKSLVDKLEALEKDPDIQNIGNIYESISKESINFEDDLIDRMKAEKLQLPTIDFDSIMSNVNDALANVNDSFGDKNAVDELLAGLRNDKL